MHRHYRFLLDAREGTQRQILRSGLGFKRLNTVLLTHSHLDHILGLAGLVSTLSRWENLDSLSPIEACIADARRATNGSPDPLAFASEMPNISFAGIKQHLPATAATGIS